MPAHLQLLSKELLAKMLRQINPHTICIKLCKITTSR